MKCYEIIFGIVITKEGKGQIVFVQFVVTKVRLIVRSLFCTMPGFIDAFFAKTSLKRSFLKRAFYRLVFAKTESINSGTVLPYLLSDNAIPTYCTSPLENQLTHTQSHVLIILEFG